MGVDQKHQWNRGFRGTCLFRGRRHRHATKRKHCDPWPGRYSCRIMNEADALELLRAAIWTIILGSGPAVAAAMFVGVIIALFQALTQIQETTLTFVPKIVAIFIALAIGAPFIGRQINSFTERSLMRVSYARILCAYLMRVSYARILCAYLMRVSYARILCAYLMRVSYARILCAYLMRVSYARILCAYLMRVSYARILCAYLMRVSYARILCAYLMRVSYARILCAYLMRVSYARILCAYLMRVSYARILCAYLMRVSYARILCAYLMRVQKKDFKHYSWAFMRSLNL